MAQRFSSLDEAAKQLGISKDRLTLLREAGKVRGYRDGASWKFRSDDIEKLVATGVPALDPPPSDLDMGSGLSLDMLVGKGVENSPAASSGLDLELTDEEALPSAATSDLNLDEIDEPTVAAAGDDEASALSLDPDEELLDLSDSILLNESELSGGAGRPPSTIIGKAELDPEADLDLSLTEQESTAMSDVKLASTRSDVLSGGDDESLDLQPPGGSDGFHGLQEIDVDLEAESSRILSSSGEPQKAKGKIVAKVKPASSGELGLAASDSDAARGASSDIGLGSDAASGAGLTGLSALELADDDQVLGEGSDITLSSESSGINIISPSDSGLALDEVPLSSASISSPLDLGSGVGQDIALEPLELSDDGGESGEEPFQLTPLGEADDDEKDSSQVIALDELAEEESTGVLFQPDMGEAGTMSEDFAGVGLGAGAVPVAAATDEVAFSLPIFGVLTVAMLFLMICGMMMFDLVRNIWSWEHEVTTLNSKLIEVVNPLL